MCKEGDVEYREKGSKIEIQKEKKGSNFGKKKANLEQKKTDQLEGKKVFRKQI